MSKDKTSKESVNSALRKTDVINSKKSKHIDYIKTDNWFAWRPVKTSSKGWVWLKTVKRTIDERPLVYLGLTPEYSYCL